MATPMLIVFVCISNTCRSPIAEHLFRDKLMKTGRGEHVRVISRSLTTAYEPEGSPASSQGIEVLREEYGIDMTEHRSKLLTQEDVAAATAIIPVKRELKQFIMSKGFEGVEEKIRLFSQDVTDPWHQPQEVYSKCASLVSNLLDEFIASSGLF